MIVISCSYGGNNSHNISNDNIIIVINNDIGNNDNDNKKKWVPRIVLQAAAGFSGQGFQTMNNIGNV